MYFPTIYKRFLYHGKAWRQSPSSDAMYSYSLCFFCFFNVFYLPFSVSQSSADCTCMHISFNSVLLFHYTAIAACVKDASAYR